MTSSLLGKECEAIAHDRDTHEWCFDFQGGLCLRVASPWRMMSDGRIAIGWQDDGQQFGLPAPIDAVEVINSLVRGRPVSDSTLDESSGDLSIVFEGGPVLQVFNSSSGYEGWQLFGPGGKTLVGLGGGSVAEHGD